MAEVKWIKITTDIFDDEKILLIESLPDAYAIITVWFKLLCLAGKQNNSGVFLMGQIPYTDKMLATIFRMKEATVTMALQTFEQFGMVEIIDGVITIPNWNKHQTLDVYEKKKARDRLYQAERRAAQKALIGQSSDCRAIVERLSDDKSSAVAVSDKEEEEEKEGEKEKDNIEKEGEKKRTKKELQFDIFEKIVSGYKITEKIKSKMYEWLEYKAEINDQYKEQGMKALLRKVETEAKKHGDDAVCEIIDESMSNGYKGIIFDKLKKRTPQHNGRTAEEKNDGFCFNPDEDDLADLF